MTETHPTHPTDDAMPALAIDYAGGGTVRPMSVVAARWVFGLGVVPGVVGVAILLLYRWTGGESLPPLGFLWLMGGGAMTFVIGVIALVSLIRALARRPREASPARWYASAMAACVLNAGLAYLCAALGTTWMDTPHFRMRVRNTTPAALDNVTVHFASGDVSVGPIAAGQSVDTGLLWVRHRDWLQITTEVGGRTRRKDDRMFGHFPQGGAGRNWTPFTIFIEPAELPRTTP